MIWKNIYVFKLFLIDKDEIKKNVWILIVGLKMFYS